MKKGRAICGRRALDGRTGGRAGGRTATAGRCRLSFGRGGDAGQADAGNSAAALGAGAPNSNAGASMPPSAPSQAPARRSRAARGRRPHLRACSRGSVFIDNLRRPAASVFQCRWRVEAVGAQVGPSARGARGDAAAPREVPRPLGERSMGLHVDIYLARCTMHLQKCIEKKPKKKSPDPKSVNVLWL